MRAARKFCVLAATLLLLMDMVGCAHTDLPQISSTNSSVHNIIPIEEFDQLPLAEKIRYFTDNVYLAATGTGGNKEDRAEAAALALDHLAGTLDKKQYADFWIGVDAEFFGRVNAVFPYEDYTRPQITHDSRSVRTLYNLSPRHLKVLRNLSAERKRAMEDFIDLAANGDSTACFAFHKAYKNYPDPRAGKNISWLDVDGKPFRKSMWEGSAEAMIKGDALQIAIPPQVVLGCRNIHRPPVNVSAGFVQDIEGYFIKVNLAGTDFNLDNYNRNKEQWLSNLRNQALDLAVKMKTDKLVITNIVVVYQIFPPQADYEYALAATEGKLTELVASNIIDEKDAFAVEEKVRERRILLEGAPVTPSNTPMAFIQLLNERPVVKRK